MTRRDFLSLPPISLLAKPKQENGGFAETSAIATAYS